MNRIVLSVLIVALLILVIPVELQWRMLSIEKNDIYRMCNDRAMQIPSQTKESLGHAIDITSTLRHNSMMLCMSDNKFVYNIFNECDPFSNEASCFTPGPSKALDFSWVYEGTIRKS